MLALLPERRSSCLCLILSMMAACSGGASDPRPLGHWQALSEGDGDQFGMSFLPNGEARERLFSQEGPVRRVRVRDMTYEASADAIMLNTSDKACGGEGSATLPFGRWIPFTSGNAGLRLLLDTKILTFRSVEKAPEDAPGVIVECAVKQSGPDAGL